MDAAKIHRRDVLRVLGLPAALALGSPAGRAGPEPVAARDPVLWRRAHPAADGRPLLQARLPAPRLTPGAGHGRDEARGLGPRGVHGLPAGRRAR